MIGAKTVSLLALLTSIVAGAALFGGLTPERLMMRSSGTLLLVGCFGVVVGTLTYRFWRLGEPSRNYFRWSTESISWDVTEGHFLGGDRRRIVLGENVDGEARDLPPRARHAVTVLVASLLALAATSSRALDQLGGVYAGFVAATSSYCPEEEAPRPVAKDPNEPGCELVRRAYALGYAKSLGDCAPKKGEATAEAARPICTRRQRDEPLLHYSWRLVADFVGKLGAERVGFFTRAREDFRKRAGHLGALRSAEAELLTSAPHASHHLWTSLPDPGDGAFEPTTCGARYAHLAHRPTPPPGPLQASLVLEHVVGQLLFEPVYDDAVGNCREFHVHWGAPRDVCARLAQNPEAVLEADGSLKGIRATLDRFRVAADLASLGGAKPPEDPAGAVSFHCYFEGDASPRKGAPFTLLGRRFEADEIAVPRSPSGSALFIDRYEAVARLFAQGFHYGALLSEAGLEQGAAAGLEGAFVSTDDLLLRLYELESIDIYLDPGWLLNRPDLLEVYPYERHLKNYVQVFRRQYRRGRGAP